ncbi:phosphonate C-P lyase system protein PhnH [Maritalea mediterranea]|uniref:Phosphonate C-P lyase system protein PhnH n=1 Tax=Maritalea mediterranea TaxID=2909667 RepID=A0ABS9EAQ5_9HYPH|nr:phosphonate C-P lyase system protein PhnH [Maritalea mediterranea]MCF4099277.1 phosphonate C-P lyase system protein PhnH [Maritalea mediterranea]
MMAAPQRNPEEAFANEAFDAMLSATARPGQIETLPAGEFGPVIAALIDRECTFFASDEVLIQQLGETGARFTPVGEADFVFCDVDEVPAILPKVKIGSDLYPDDGATLIVAAGVAQGDKLRLSGPGIKGHDDVMVAGFDRAVWDHRARQIRYPTGFDMLIVDGAQLMALPRSTTVEVL